MKTINYAGFCHCRIAELLDCWEMFTKFKCLGAAAQPAFRESAFIFSPREERQAKEQRERSHAYSFNLLARFALHTTTLTYKVANNKKLKPPAFCCFGSKIVCAVLLALEQSLH